MPHNFLKLLSARETADSLHAFLCGGCAACMGLQLPGASDFSTHRDHEVENRTAAVGSLANLVRLTLQAV